MQNHMQNKKDGYVPSSVTLCVDIGSGTQDALLALPDEKEENWPRFILPAPARRIAARIRALSAQQKHIWLCGGNMGGGFAAALKAHRDAGLHVTATLAASRALHDRVDVVQAQGISLTEHCPQGHVPVFLTDFDWGSWTSLLQCAFLPQPDTILIAVQDHGFSEISNREARMRMWRELLQRSPDPRQWIFEQIPSVYTRMQTVQNSTGGMVADTGTAAVLGALSVPEIRTRSHKQGILIVNVGNSHVLAFLVYQEKVYGIYEHHTGLRTSAELVHDLEQFRLGWLPDEEVRASNGHGTAFATLPGEAEGFVPTYIFGPQRALLQGYGQFCAPHGEMMLAGCHGLLYALKGASNRAV